MLKEAYEKRKSLWTQFDVNGNGFLSLAEVTKVHIMHASVLPCHGQPHKILITYFREFVM